eukprot:Plantae.Rhodophyta-Purpureofilum_apyrenoidigerum.ctg16192.p1 GENE.Plantae.Rhodophyta-Purpureofilum_apyrenoidigerum.ctg16192~~Plantae.Rhodophyta-Purpureofilum_apyrenoidigerum.ctg16192.p1  ORF type:complete len:235 (+),score=17.71 Plantae.Rhodophyta-Purpureofilum_apyrenoidigerum.ctg16192:86-790(+)
MQSGRRRLLLLAAGWLLWTGCSEALQDVNCNPGGNCVEIQNRFIELVEGEVCRQLYATGKCNSVCLKSLQAITSRSKWSRCAQRCYWTKTFVQAAESWLDLCGSLPVRGDYSAEDSNGAALKDSQVQDNDVPADETLLMGTPFRQREGSEYVAVAFFVVCWIALGLYYASRHGSSFGILPKARLWLHRKFLKFNLRLKRRDKLPDSASDASAYHRAARGARKHLLRALSPRHTE